MFWKKKGKVHYPVKMLAIAMTVTMVFSSGALPVVAQAATTSNSDFTIENGVLTSYQGKGGVVTIPNGVTSIGDQAFAECTSLTGITIPSSVTSIGNSVFEACINLTSINIPASVRSIGYDTFSYCTNLNSITIPSSVTSIGSDAFLETPWLAKQGKFAVVNHILVAYQGKDSNITIPNNVTSIGDSAFARCTSLTKVTIPSCVTSIGNGSFFGCTNLKSIIIPSSVTSIVEYYAFDSDPNLTLTVSNGSYAESYAKRNGIPYVIAGTTEKYVAVANITGVPTSVTAGTSLTLSGSITPSNATKKAVTWTVKNAGTTGATINGNTLMAKTPGTVTISATVKNGASKNRDYTQDFSIMVKSSSLKVDTGFKLSVGKGNTYQFKITSDTKPTFVCGTPSTFTVRFNGSKGHDYFYVVMAVGKAGQAAGFYVNGSRCTVGTVTAPTAKVDTGSKLSVKRAKSYQFKVTYSCKPTFVCGTPSTFSVRYNGSKGSDYFYVVTAVGKVGQAAGFYLNGIRCTIGSIK